MYAAAMMYGVQPAGPGSMYAAAMMYGVQPAGPGSMYAAARVYGVRGAGSRGTAQVTFLSSIRTFSDFHRLPTA
jgi:hypothetical protein